MDHRRLLVVTVAALVPPALAVGMASATPPSGVTPVPHVLGAALPDRVSVNADRIRFQTKDPAEVSVLTLTVEPGGETGWHSHPGLAVISVTDGTGTLYSAGCAPRAYGAGQAFLETGDDEPTNFVNEGAEPVVLTVAFVAPEGEAVIRDEAAPSCARG